MKTVKHLTDLSAFLLFAPVLLRGETIQECIKRTEVRSKGGDQVIDRVHTEDNKRTFNLYKSQNELTWCASFMKCKEKGQQLAVVHDRFTQEFLFNNSLYNVSSGHAWLAGRRKDFGTNWTWLSDEMAPLENKWTPSNGPGPLGRMTVLSGTINLNTGAELLKNFICVNSVPNHRNVSSTWYEAMNGCADIEGRLAVYQEVVDSGGKFKYHTNKVRSYWIGLYYKPWIWILGGDNNVTYRPVYHSFWKNVSNAQQFSNDDRCLAVEVNSGKWVAHPCDNSLKHFICQNEAQSTTTHRNAITAQTENRQNGTKEDIVPTKEVYMETTTRDNRAYDRWIVVIISAPVSVSVLFLLVSVCVLICVWKNKKDTGMNSVNLVSLSHADTSIKTKKKVPLGSPMAQHEYSFLRDSMIYTKPKNLKPHLPPRDQTYNQPYEDTRLETESQTETETDLGKIVEQPKREVDGFHTVSEMDTGNESWKSEEEYLDFSQNAKPENVDGPLRVEADGVNTLACVTHSPVGKITNGLKNTLINNRVISNDVREFHRPKTAFY